MWLQKGRESRKKITSSILPSCVTLDESDNSLEFRLLLEGSSRNEMRSLFYNMTQSNLTTELLIYVLLE